MSYDIVELFLKQDPETMLCHPFADQMIAIWLEKLNLGHILRHDSRIHHDPIVKETPGLKGRKYVCQDYIAIHGSSSTDIRTFWKNKGRPKQQNKYDFLQIAKKCQLKFYFDWTNLGFWQHEPKPCIKKPVWNTGRYQIKNEMYIGRLGNGNQ